MASLRFTQHALSRPRIFLTNFRSVSSSSSSPTRQTASLFRTGVYTTVIAVTTGLLAVYYFDSRSAIHRYVLTPLLRYTVDPETGHKLAVKVIASGLGPKDTQTDHQNLRTQVN